MPSATIKFNTDLRESKKAVKTAIDYFEFLDSFGFAQANKKRFEQGAVAPVKEAALKIVDMYVYSYTPETPEPYYTRTFKLRRSIKVEKGENNIEGEIYIYSDPTIAHGKIGYGNEHFSYAAFFIQPVEFSTFLRPRGQVSRNTYRPFFQAWEQFMLRYAPRKAMKAIIETQQKSMPISMR